MKEIIKQNYEALKEIFVAGCVEGGCGIEFKSTPFIKFMKRAGVVDRNLTTSIIDTYFSATNYEESDNDDNPDNALQRFEFLEILIRVAKGKYMDFGNETNIASAL